MFGIGTGEIIFILFVLLLVFGADKIPDMAKNLGQGLRSIRNATNDLKSEITKEKDDFSGMGNESLKDLKDEASKVKEDIEKITGAIKRKF
jgi:sec-independent protein translocase protein TatA